MRRPSVIEKIRSMFRNHFPEIETILYGSEARGTAREDSDIDLLLLLPDSVESIPAAHVEIGRKVYDIELETGVSISTLLFKKSSWGKNRTPFYCNVVNEGIRL